MDFEVCLFGEVRAYWGGRALDLGGSRARALFAVLALHPRQAVSHERLVEYAWQSGMAGADELLAASVSRLRGALAPAGGQALVRSVRGGFAAEVDPGAVDAHRFHALLETAGTTPAGDVERGVRLRRALDLWGEQTRALVDVHSDWLREQARLLEGRRLDALEYLAGVEVDAGRPQRALDLLRDVVPAPQRQGLAAVLIRALLGAGQGVRALQVAHAVTEALAQRGWQPDPGLRAAMQATLGPHSSASRRGPRQLPADTALFTGRGSELERLLALAGQARSDGPPGGTVVINAIDGMGGIGKTTLAVRAAHRLAGRFPDGQLFLDLHGFTQGSAPRDPGDALAALLGGLGVPPGRLPADLEARAALYRDRLAGTRTLIVLDNALGEAQIRPLLPACDTCLVLITSRRRLTALDDALPLPLDVLPIEEAMALLRKTARLDVDPADEPLLERAAELCGRLPLALVIAGALLRTGGKAWNLRLLLDRLAARRPGRELAGYSDETRSLTATFDLSYRNLPDDQQRLFRRLGLLPGPEVDAYAAAALQECDPDEAGRLLGRLADHSLLSGAAPGRYHLHDLVRAHARALIATLDAEPVRAGARDRLLHYYAHTALSASLPVARLPRHPPSGPAPAHAPELTDPPTARAWLRAEHPNLQAAYAHATTHALEGHAIALAAAMAEILQIDGPWSRALGIHRAAAAAAAGGNRPAAHATALHDLGRIQYLTGDYPGATDTLVQALEISRRIGDRRGEANALTLLGKVWYRAEDFPRATDAFEQTLRIYRRAGIDLGEANALTDLGQVRYLAGAHPQARDAIVKALEIYRRIGNHRGEASALNELGRIRYLTGDYPGADDAHAQALQISRQIGERRGEANALDHLGHVRHEVGDYPRAADALAQALDIHRQLGDRQGEANSLNYLGRVRSLTGDFTEAADTLARALEIYRGLGDRIGEAGTLTELGRVRCAMGDLSWAAHAQAQALEIVRRIGDRIDEAWVLNRYAATIAATGDRSRALTLYRQALTMCRELNSPAEEALCLEGIAEHHLTAGDPTQGTEHLREALRIYQRLGMRPDAERVTVRLAD